LADAPGGSLLAGVPAAGAVACSGGGEAPSGALLAAGAAGGRDGGGVRAGGGGGGRGGSGRLTAGNERSGNSESHGAAGPQRANVERHACPLPRVTASAELGAWSHSGRSQAIQSRISLLSACVRVRPESRGGIEQSSVSRRTRDHQSTTSW